MNMDNNLINKVVKSLANQTGSSKELTKFYGTVYTVDGRKCVKLDGSDVYTAVVEGTEVMDGDRVLVGIENHQAVVYANITSPASARTATNFMDLTEDGLVIGQLRSSSGEIKNILLGSLSEGEEGVYLRVGDTVLAKFFIDPDGEPATMFGPYIRTGTNDNYTAFVDSRGINVFKNYSEWGFDEHVVIGSSYIGVNMDAGISGSNIEIDNGRVTAAYGCNAKIIYVDVTESNIDVDHGSNSGNWTTSVNVPTGYTPCGLIAYQILGHINTCCFTRVDLDTDGTITFCIQNHGSTDWTDVGAYFQVACIWTG